MVYVFEPMNKPKLINVLKMNFKNMLLLDVYNRNCETGFLKSKQKTYELINGKQKRYFLVTASNKLTTQATFLNKKKPQKLLIFAMRIILPIAKLNRCSMG